MESVSQREQMNKTLGKSPHLAFNLNNLLLAQSHRYVCFSFIFWQISEFISQLKTSIPDPHSCICNPCCLFPVSLILLGSVPSQTPLESLLTFSASPQLWLPLDLKMLHRQEVFLQPWSFFHSLGHDQYKFSAVSAHYLRGFNLSKSS